MASSLCTGNCTKNLGVSSIARGLEDCSRNARVKASVSNPQPLQHQKKDSGGLQCKANWVRIPSFITRKRSSAGSLKALQRQPKSVQCSTARVLLEQESFAASLPETEAPLGRSSNKGSEAPQQAIGPCDIVILTNGPGEVATWVKPVVQALRRRLGEDRGNLRISVVLSPCPHASQQEAALVRSFAEVDRCQEAQHFSSLLLGGKTAEGWDWRKNGVCLFLGGDQFNALLIGWRLGYRTVLYAEEAVRWAWLADKYVLRNASLVESVPSFARGRCKVVGDLFVDAVAGSTPIPSNRDHASSRSSKLSMSTNGKVRKAIVEDGASMSLATSESATEAQAERLRSHSEASSHHALPRTMKVGLLPGSKPAKLGLGVPYFLAAAEHIQSDFPNVRFVLPLAPTVSLEDLAAQASADTNPSIRRFSWASGSLQRLRSSESPRFALEADKRPVATLTSSGGARVEVFQHFPAYDVFRDCDVCLTTIGTNTAELGSLGVPMIVVLPTHSLEVFRGATGGIGGLLANLPGRVGDVAARAVNTALLKTAGFVSWPNRWAGEAVVPELIGRIEPQEVAAVAVDLLKHPAKLVDMQNRLARANKDGSGQPDDGRGAADRIAQEVEALLTQTPQLIADR